MKMLTIIDNMLFERLFQPIVNIFEPTFKKNQLSLFVLMGFMFTNFAAIYFYITDDDWDVFGLFAAGLSIFASSFVYVRRSQFPSSSPNPMREFFLHKAARLLCIFAVGVSLLPLTGGFNFMRMFLIFCYYYLEACDNPPKPPRRSSNVAEQPIVFAR